MFVLGWIVKSHLRISLRIQKLAPAPVHRLTQEERYVEHNTKDVAQIYKDITALTKTKVIYNCFVQVIVFFVQLI
jgi:hypothetical protein